MQWLQNLQFHSLQDYGREYFRIKCKSSETQLMALLVALKTGLSSLRVSRIGENISVAMAMITSEGANDTYLGLYD